jgi:hypothetical protein
MTSAPSAEDTVGSESRGFVAERLTFFWDAVVTIAITLLELPEGSAPNCCGHSVITSSNTSPFWSAWSAAA